MMKALVFVCALFAGAAAQAQTYSGTHMLYYNSGGNDPEMWNIQGAKMKAVDRALLECHQAGNRHCALVNIDSEKAGWNSKTNRMEYTFLAQVAAYDALNLTEGQPIPGEQSWTHYRNTGNDSALKADGIRLDALTDALNACYQVSSICAVVDAVPGNFNAYDGVTSSGQYKYVTSARATVIPLYPVAAASEQNLN